jgi:hypothetical protein
MDENLLLQHAEITEPIGDTFRNDISFNLAEIQRKIVVDKQLSEGGIFHSQKDQKNAQQFWELIQKKIAGLSTEDFQGLSSISDVLESFNSLLPNRSPDGRRVIAGAVLTPGLEKLIASRLNSTEVDITGTEASWGALPEHVQTAILRDYPVNVELTDTCSVNCSFCALSKRGLITRKASFNSLRKLLMQAEKAKSRNAPTFFQQTDSFYYGTDPFDWKAKDAEAIGSELDYLDLFKLHQELLGSDTKHNRSLETSTALPLGEELRVLEFMGYVYTEIEAGRLDKQYYLRISRTNANNDRAQALHTIASFIFGTDFAGDGDDTDAPIKFTSNRHNNVALAGPSWRQSREEYSTWDILGPNCRDEVIIGTQSVDMTIMMASSNQYYNGEHRQSITGKNESGERIFSFPCYSYASISSPTPPGELYPDVEMITYSERSLIPETTTITNDPHRCFLRVVGLEYYLGTSASLKLGWPPKNEDLPFIRSVFQKDLQIVYDYLQSGAENYPMQQRMQSYMSMGLFVPNMRDEEIAEAQTALKVKMKEKSAIGTFLWLYLRKRII